VRQRAGLAIAMTAFSGSSSASALAREYVSTAERLRPVAGPRGAVLLSRLRGSARAYDRLAAADPGGFNAIRHEVANADADLGAAVAGLRIESAIQPRVRPPARTTRHLRQAGLLLFIALAGGLVASWPIRLPRSSGPQPIETPVERVAPGWRWDSAPRLGGADPRSTLGNPPPPL
jgi:hypothetical protein